MLQDLVNSSTLGSRTTTQDVIEWLGLEGTIKAHLIQPSSSEQRHLQPEQVAQSPKVQPDLEWCQGGGFYHPSEHTESVSQDSDYKTFLPYV